MKLTILGAGTCGSQLPGIANQYPPAFVVEWDKEKILFDCSEGVRFRLEQAGFNYADIHHIAISHPHADHYSLIPFVQSICCWNLWAGPPNKQIDIYAPKVLVEEFPTMWKMFCPDDSERKIHAWPILTFHALPDPNRSTISIGSGSLSAFEVYHGFGKTGAVAFRLETPEGVFAYSGDTGECTGIRQVCQGADLFVCEASARIGNFESPHAYGHLHPRLVGEIAREGNVKKLVLFHYTGLDSDEAMIQDCRESGYAGEIVCGKDFSVIQFSQAAICS